MEKGPVIFLVLALLAISSSSGATTPTHVACDDGWNEYDGNCYYLGLEQKTWHSAQDWCNGNGAHLAKIESGEEHEFIHNVSLRSYFRSPMWIGLTTITGESTAEWRWYDDTKPAFTAWHPDEPDDDANAFCAYQHYADPLCIAEDDYDDIHDYIGELEPDDERVILLSDDWMTCYDCRELCRKTVACVAYTNMAWDLEHGYRCLGRTNETWIGEPSGDTCSGTKYPCHEDPSHINDGDWFNSNCGASRGFVCKKPSGQDLVTITVPTEVVPGHCPSGFIEAGNKCYHIETIENEASGYTWDHALRKCRYLQGGIRADLASFNDEVEMATVAMHMYGTRIGYWIGIYRPGDYEPWMWTDNSPTDYQNWRHKPPKAEGDQACGEIWTVPGPTGTWNPHSCNTKRGFVCQIYKDPGSPLPSPAPTQPSVKCPDGYDPYWQSCYKYGKSAASWSDADKSCEDGHGGSLVSIMDAAENSFLFLQYANNFKTPLWIGLERSTSYSEWLWSDTWPVRYDNWAVGEPDSREKSLCTVMNPDGTWSATVCSESYTAICKYTEESAPTKPPTVEGDCPGDETAGWHSFGGHCYYFESSIWVAFSWQQAEDQCQQKTKEDSNQFEGHLASIHSYHENEFIHDYIKDRSEFSSSWSVYIGLHQESDGEPFRWSDGTSNQFTFYLPGEPKNDKDKRCTAMIRSPDYNDGFWESVSCSEAKSYVCKAEKIPAPTRPPYVEGQCPEDDWMEYGADCYKMFGKDRDDAKMWHQADDKCKEIANGGTLVSIYDSLQNELIADIVRNTTKGLGDQTWIGLKRTSRDPDEFAWSDRSDFKWSNFPTPSTWGESQYEDCVWLNAADPEGTWEITDCRNSRGYICRAPKQDIQTTTDLPSTPGDHDTTVPPQEATTVTDTPTLENATTIGANTTDSLEPETGKGGLPGGAIAGIVIGCLLLVALASFVGYIYIKRRNFPPYERQNDPDVAVPDNLQIQNASQGSSDSEANA